MLSDRLSQIADRLLDLSRRVEPADLFPALIPEASEFARHNHYAFCMATCLDRGMPAQVVWTIPYDMQQVLGHLDPLRIHEMTLTELATVIGRLPRRPRFVNDAPRTIHDLTRIVVNDFEGDAAGIWRKRSAAEVRETFSSIHGVGRGIANMAVLLIERAFGIRFSDLDHHKMDIKPDVQTVKVLHRLGVSVAKTENATIEAARRLRPEYPGELDAALWRIGREWCHAARPDCARCPMDALCPKADVLVV